jgi:hypothetical protein
MNSPPHAHTHTIRPPDHTSWVLLDPRCDRGVYAADYRYCSSSTVLLLLTLLLYDCCTPETLGNTPRASSAVAEQTDKQRKSQNPRSNWTLRQAVRMYKSNWEKLGGEPLRRRGVGFCGTMVVDDRRRMGAALDITVLDYTPWRACVRGQYQLTA